MLKALAIFALLAYPVASPPADRDKEQGHPNKHCQVDEKPIAPCVLTINQFEIQPQEEPSKQESQWWYKAGGPQTWASWALFIAAVWAGRLALITLRAIRLQNAAFINSQRPWLLVTIEPWAITQDIFQVRVTNHGPSPAQIVAYSDAEIRHCLEGQEMPTEPEYRSIQTPSTSIILVTGESGDLTEFSKNSLRNKLNSEQLAQVASWDRKLYVYGVVYYHDLINPHPQKPHETRWCFRYIPNSKGNRLIQHGPENYNRHT
jgi:hypothetical protein